jgi:SAM-dependent methyltransferase
MNRTIDYYNTNAPNLARRYEGADVKKMQQQLLETFPEGSRLLEIGSGSGREAAFLLAHRRDVRCIEASESMVIEALRIHPELEGRIVCGMVPGSFPSDPAGFEGIYAVASLMHLAAEPLTETLHRIRAALKPGGRFLFSVPLQRPGLDETGIDTGGRYFHMLEKTGWDGLLADTGFSVLRFETFGDGLDRADVVWGSWVCG